MRPDPRICHLTSAHIAADARIFYRELLSLRKVYDDVHLVACTETPEAVVQGIHVYGHGPRRNPLCRVGTLRRMYRQAVALQADIYHAHEPDSWLVAYLAARRVGARFVLDAHELHHETFREQHAGLVPRGIAWGVKRLTKYLAPRADLLVTVTESVADILRRDFGARRPLVLYNAPWPTPRERLPNKSPQAVAFVGGMAMDRGMDVLLHALALVRRRLPITLIWAGKVLENEERLWQDLVRARGLEKAVRFLGFVPAPDLAAAVGMAPIGMQLDRPTVNNLNGIGSKQFTYMDACMAQVARDFPETTRMVRAHEAGLVVGPPFSAEQYADAILYLLEHLDETSRMGLNGRRALEEQYGWHLMEPKLLEAYEELVSRAASGQ